MIYAPHSNHQPLLRIASPLTVVLPRKTKADKKFSLNLNVYRNTHPRILNDTKRIYKELMFDFFDSQGWQDLVLPEELDITFRLFKGANRRTDKSNFFAIQAKYLYDTMVEYGMISDDNDDVIKKELLLPTRLDRVTPRAEFTFDQSLDT